MGFEAFISLQLPVFEVCCSLLMLSLLRNKHIPFFYTVVVGFVFFLHFL